MLHKLLLIAAVLFSSIGPAFSGVISYTYNISGGFWTDGGIQDRSLSGTATVSPSGYILSIDAEVPEIPAHFVLAFQYAWDPFYDVDLRSDTGPYSISVWGIYGYNPFDPAWTPPGSFGGYASAGLDSYQFDGYASSNFYRGGVNFTFASANFAPVPANYASVPGPVVGAGLPSLITACAGLIAWALKRKRGLA